MGLESGRVECSSSLGGNVENELDLHKGNKGLVNLIENIDCVISSILEKSKMKVLLGDIFLVDVQVK